MSENDYTEDELRELFSFTDGDKTWPFFESENAEIVGYGHQDKEAFAAAVNDYDQHMGADAEGHAHDHRDVTYRYVVLDGPRDGLDGDWTYRWAHSGDGNSHLEPYTADHPDAIPVTGIWNVR